MTTTPDAVDALARAFWPYSTEVGLAIPIELKSATDGVMKRILDAGFTITRAEPVGFEAAIKQLGEPDVATGHWSLDEGNLRWFVGQLKAKPAMTEAELEREAFQLAVDIWECGAERDRKNDTDKCKQWIVELAKKYREVGDGKAA